VFEDELGEDEVERVVCEREAVAVADDPCEDRVPREVGRVGVDRDDLAGERLREAVFVPAGAEVEGSGGWDRPQEVLVGVERVGYLGKDRLLDPSVHPVDPGRVSTKRPFDSVRDRHDLSNDERWQVRSPVACR